MLKFEEKKTDKGVGMKAIDKSLLRSIRKSKMRFFYIMAIVALGASFFIGLKGVGPSIRKTAQEYFDERELADAHLVSEYAFTEDDLKRLSEVDGVSRVEGAYSMDVVTQSGGASYVTKIYSWSGEEALNNPLLKEGRMPQRSDECVVQYQDAENSSVKIGDKIAVTDQSQSADILKNLKPKNFEVVGFVYDPLYLTHGRGSTNIGKGTIDNYMIVPDSAFTYERYTDAWILSTDTKDGISPFSGTYRNDMEKIMQGLSDQEDENVEIQFTKIIDAANDQIREGEDELEDGKKTYEAQIAQAQSQLDEAREELDAARVKLDDASRELEEGQAELDTGRTSLAAGQAELDAGRTELEENQEKAQASKTQLDEGESQLEEGQRTLDEKRAELEKQKQALATQKRALEEGLSQIEAGLSSISAAKAPVVQMESELKNLEEALLRDPDNETLLKTKASLEAALSATQESPQYQAALSQEKALLAKKEQAEAGLQTIGEAENQISQGEDEMARAQSQIDQNRRALQSGRAQLQAGEAQLQEGFAQLQSGQAQLDASADALNQAQSALQEGRASYLSGEREYEEGLSQYQSGLDELEAQKEKAQEEFDEAEKKLSEARAEVDKLTAAEFYTYDRTDNIGYSDFNENAERIDRIANIFPVFFMMVAMLVAFSTMTRMVEEERTEIGTLMALGYTRQRILLKYALYAGLAALIGWVIGAVFGATFFPWFIYNAYVIMYSMPDVSIAVDWSSVVISFITSLLCTVGAAVMVALYEMRQSPAELMRPKAPKPGKRVFLERIPWFWNRLSFIAKVSARNVLRYKARFFMTVLGIAGCTALLLTGFGLHDAIFTIIPNQFEKIQFYDDLVIFDQGRSEAEQQPAFDVIRDDARVENAELVSQEQMSVYKEKGEKSLSVYIVSPSDTEKLKDFIHFSDRTDKAREVKLEEGSAVITERMSKLLGAKKGDTVTIDDGKAQYQVKVGDVTENYLENYLYITPSTYQQVTGKAPLYNTAYVNLTAEGKKNEAALAEDLIKHDQILTVQNMQESVDSANSSMQSLNAIVVVIVLFSGILAFIVLFNLTTINISERIREIATLKVLGFQEKETKYYVFRENIILSSIGMVIGLFLGLILLNFILVTVETDIMMFGRQVFWQSYVYACGMTILFTLIVNWAMGPTINRIDMVEALKSIE